MFRLKKGISPVIATVIIVAVAVAIAIAVVGWIMGIWGTFGATESLQIMPDSYLESEGTLHLHVKNTGSAAAVIYKIEIPGLATTNVSITLGPGESTTTTINMNTSFTPGATYQVKVYTEAGNVYPATVECKG